jgi:hypothetical protein
MNWISMVQNILQWPAITIEENFLSILTVISVSKATLLPTDTQTDVNKNKKYEFLLTRNELRLHNTKP